MRQFIFITLATLFFIGGCSASGSDIWQENKNATSIVESTPTLSPTSDATATRTITPMSILPPIRTPEVHDSLPNKGTVEFHIIHWNDFHGELGEHNFYGSWVPGAARLAAFVKSEKARYQPGQVLTLDGGDWFQGSPYSINSQGMKVLELYKRLGVDAITVGNHDFFMGVPRFYKIVSEAAPIEILSVNLRRSGTGNTCTDKRILSPYKIFELGEAQGPKVRVAVIGASMKFLEEESRMPILGICFPDPAEKILEIYDQLIENEKPDVLVVLSHSGFAQDRELAQKLNKAGKPVDIIIGGHSHTWIDKVEKVGETSIVQVGGLGNAVGVFDLIYNRASKKLDVNWRQEIFSLCSPIDDDTVEFLRDTLPTPTPSKAIAIIKNPDYDYLIDRQTVHESVGYWTLGKGRFPALDAGMVPCDTIVSHRKEYPFGLFAHSPSKLQYAIDGNYKTFVAEISIKETACGDGASFAVRVDDREIYRSDNMLPSSKPISLSLDVTGGKVLTLETISGNDISCDWTIWGDPYLVK
jgi:5'-nucleotidase